MVSKVFGISRVPHAGYVYFAMNPNRSFAYLCDEGDEETTDGVDKKIREMKALGDDRPAVVVVEGSAEWIQKWLSDCTEADVLICVGDSRMLERLGIAVVDRDWKAGQPPVDLDSLVHLDE